MPTFDIDTHVDFEFEVYCSCGNGLCANTKTRSGRNGNQWIEVEPCEKCLEKARDEAIQDVDYIERG